MRKGARLPGPQSRPLRSRSVEAVESSFACSWWPVPPHRLGWDWLAGGPGRTLRAWGSWCSSRSVLSCPSACARASVLFQFLRRRRGSRGGLVRIPFGIGAFSNPTAVSRLLAGVSDPVGRYSTRGGVGSPRQSFARLSIIRWGIASIRSSTRVSWGGN